MDVHVRDLRSFLTVAEEGNFTRAAGRLHLSQPALSKQVKALERQLGSPLFTRGRTGSALTPAGHALLPHARATVETWEAGAAALAQVREAERGALTIGMSTSPGREGLLPAVRSRFSRDRPQVRLRLRQVGWQDPTAGLADGSSDLAYVWLPLPAPQRYAHLVVAEEPRVLALHEDHPLAAREEVRFADLLDEPFLALPQEAGVLRAHWLALDHRGGRASRVAAEVATTEETYEALASDLGVVLVATGNVPLLARPRVTTRPVLGLAPTRFALAWPKSGHHPLAPEYARACRAALRAMRRA